MQTVTLHTEIGFNVNVQIIQDALNLYFNITDDYLAKPIAQRIWVGLCSATSSQRTRDSKVWGSKEILDAIGALNFRMKLIGEQVLTNN